MSVFLKYSLSYIFRQGLLLNLELARFRDLPVTPSIGLRLQTSVSSRSFSVCLVINLSARGVTWILVLVLTLSELSPAVLSFVPTFLGHKPEKDQKFLLDIIPPHT